MIVNPRVSAAKKAEREKRREFNKAVRKIESEQAGTAQTAARLRLSGSPIERLKRRNALTVYELIAADEILHAYRTVVGLPARRDPDLDIPSYARPDAADEMSARRADMLHAYRRWRADLAGIQALAVATAIIIDEKSIGNMARELRCRYGTTLSQLRVGLRHFAALRGNTPRDARGWKYPQTINQRADKLTPGKIARTNLHRLNSP